VLLAASFGSAAGQGLPSDDLLHPTWVEQGASVSVRHEFDRTILRPGFAWQDSLGNVVLELLDTATLLRDPSPARLDGDFGFHAAASRALAGGSGLFSWSQTGQIEGQFAREGALGGTRTRGQAVAGWNRPVGSFRLGGWGGLLWERLDPSAATPSLTVGEPAAEGALATSVFALEGAWDRSGETGDRWISAYLLRDAGAADLREESGAAQAVFQTTRPWKVGVEAGIEALRRRSEVLGQDRDVVRRSVVLSSTVEPGWGQEIPLRVGLADTLALDYAGRVPGDDAWGVSGGAGLAGDLPWGFFHVQDLSAIRGDHGVLDVEGGQGELERSQSSEDRAVRLADTLGWRTEALGGLAAKAGWTRSLARRRHPQNPDPGVSDRPDQDLSETGVGASVRDSALARDDKPLLAWSWLRRDEVYLRAVHSAETRRREGHRLAADAAWSPVPGIRVEAGSVAREQRTRWRFDSTRDEGLMEWQWDAALQEGSARRPRGRAWVEQRLTWVGGLIGDDFAIERRSVAWKAGLRGWLWWKGAHLSPWAERWSEVSSVWDGSRLGLEPGREEWRAALEGEAPVADGVVRLEVLRVLPDPGADDWRVTGEARWTW